MKKCSRSLCHNKSEIVRKRSLILGVLQALALVRQLWSFSILITKHPHISFYLNHQQYILLSKKVKPSLHWCTFSGQIRPHCRQQTSNWRQTCSANTKKLRNRGRETKHTRQSKPRNKATNQPCPLPPACEGPASSWSASGCHNCGNWRLTQAPEKWKIETIYHRGLCMATIMYLFMSPFSTLWSCIIDF